MTNYCFTLAFNLPSEVEKVLILLHEKNSAENFKHLIVDLGFPIVEGDKIPDDIEEAKRINTAKLEELAKKYGSNYVQMPNIGVSQNWTQVYKFLMPKDDDVLIGCDPDEHPKNRGWVKAMGDVIRAKDLALCSLMLKEHISIVETMPKAEMFVRDCRVLFLPPGSLNWALIGVSGKFLNRIKEIPYPEEAPVYGWIEGSLYPLFEKHNMMWAVLPDYQVEHTDFEWGHAGTSVLLRLWKNDIVFKIKEIGQPSFEEWLIKRRDGK